MKKQITAIVTVTPVDFPRRVKMICREVRFGLTTDNYIDGPIETWEELKSRIIIDDEHLNIAAVRLESGEECGFGVRQVMINVSD